MIGRKRKRESTNRSRNLHSRKRKTVQTAAVYRQSFSDQNQFGEAHTWTQACLKRGIPISQDAIRSRRDVGMRDAGVEASQAS
jgi:hypothetical protein